MISKTKIAGIYWIKNKFNNKIYIGSSKYVKKRLNRHLNRLKNNKHDNEHLQNAFNKYGIENFQFELIACILDLTKLRCVELNFLNQFNCCDRLYGYNKSITTTHGTLTTKGREKLKLANSGKKYSKETNSKKGSPGKLNPFYGKTHSFEMKKKILTNRGLKCEPFICIETGDVFNFFNEASKKLNCRQNTISQCLKNKMYVSNGYHFIFINKLSFSYKIINNKIELTQAEKARLISNIDPRRKLFKCIQTNEIFSSLNIAGKHFNICRVMLSKQLNGTRKSSLNGYNFQYI